MRFCLAGALALSFGACAVAVPPAPPAAGVDAERLAELYRRQDCFAMRDALVGATDDPVVDFYRAAVAVAFNRPDEAIEEVRRFLDSPEAAADPARRRTAKELLSDAYIRTFRYGEAEEVYASVAADVGLDSVARENAANVRGLWGALAGTPPQTVETPGPVRVATTRDRANLVNVLVEAGGERIDFVYDTGANLSTVTESTARRMGFRVLDDSVRVGSISARFRPDAATVPIAPDATGAELRHPLLSRSELFPMN